MLGLNWLKSSLIIYVINLKGYAYTTGEDAKKEGDVLFGAGSRNGVQITFLINNPFKKGCELANIHVATVPDYSNFAQKMAWLRSLSLDDFKIIKINQQHDWANFGDETFRELLPVVSKYKSENAIMTTHASGIKTNIDDYVYDWSRTNLECKVRNLIKAYDETLLKLKEITDIPVLKDIDNVINNNDSRIKWTTTLKKQLLKNAHQSTVSELKFEKHRMQQIIYRPFIKKWLYVDDRILSSVRQILKIFPQDERRILVDQPIKSHTHMKGNNDLSVVAILITPPPTAPFSMLATSIPNDLASIKGSMQTKAIFRIMA